MFGFSEIAIILIVVVVLLGAKKLPELTRSAGRATRILKKELRASNSTAHGDDTRTDGLSRGGGGVRGGRNGTSYR